MNIIFGDQVKNLPNSYTVLELDTLRMMPSMQVVPVWCVIETVSLENIHRWDSDRKLHQDLIAQYKVRNWSFCAQAIAGLLGSWNKELDSFYLHLLERVNLYQHTEPPADWEPMLIKQETAANSDAVNDPAG